MTTNQIAEHVFAGAEEICEQCDDVYEEDECYPAGHNRILDPVADLRWEICDRCGGNGELGGYPGVYTADDFAEDPDFAEDYHVHRRPCEDCGGSGKVRALKPGAETRPALRAWIDGYYEMRAVERAERLMGA